MGSLSKNQFYKLHADKRDKRNIQAAAIMGYICAAATLLLGVLVQNYFVLIDVVVILGLALGVQLAQNRACAVIFLVYGIINVILNYIATGKVSGWWLVLVGIYAIDGTFKLHKAYQKYLAGASEPSAVSEQ